MVTAREEKVSPPPFSPSASPLGDISSPSPRLRQWLIGGGAALLAHAIAAAPFLPAPKPPPVADIEQNVTEIGVSLAPHVRPPEPPPEMEPEPEPETPVIEERATNSPPPAPPAVPREIPDLPDIRPQAVPDLWRGSAGSGGSLTLEEYLRLKDWLDAARAVILKELSYPAEARRIGLSGSAVVAIVARRDGRIATWSFQTRTGEVILDREISDSINRIRRLPKFPKDTVYDTLTFTLPIRFELVFQNRRRPQATDEPGSPGGPPASDDAAAAQGYSAEALGACAASAAALEIMRADIEAQRSALETSREEYERVAARYRKQQRELPARARRQLEAYNEGIAAYDAAITAFQSEATAFNASCGAASATWENYARACAAYRTSGNSYCEAFGDLWARLQSGE